MGVNGQFSEGIEPVTSSGHSLWTDIVLEDFFMNIVHSEHKNENENGGNDFDHSLPLLSQCILPSFPSLESLPIPNHSPPQLIIPSSNPNSTPPNPQCTIPPLPTPKPPTPIQTPPLNGSYYKCSRDGCKINKHVERCTNDQRMVLTTYFGCHNHEATTNFSKTTRF